LKNISQGNFQKINYKTLLFYHKTSNSYYFRTHFRRSNSYTGIENLGEEKFGEMRIGEKMKRKMPRRTDIKHMCFVDFKHNPQKI